MSSQKLFRPAILLLALMQSATTFASVQNQQAEDQLSKPLPVVVQPMGRLQNRVQNRIASRIGNRINPGQPAQPDTLSPFRAPQGTVPPAKWVVGRR